MSRKFREWSTDQNWLFPPSPQDWLPEDHQVYFLLQVSEQIDISPIVNDYDSEKGGQPPFHPRMMLVLLLYSYSVGVFSSRKIMARCETDVAFRVIVGEDIPDFRRVSEFRRRHLEQMPVVVHRRVGIVPRSRSAERWSTCFGRYEGEGQRIASQGDELRPHDC